MGYVQRYKKEHCTKATDVSWDNIKNIAKVSVPAMVISTFTRRVAPATAAFDVFVEVDSQAGKGRVVVKKVPPSDIVLDWIDGHAMEARKNVAKVKAVIAEWYKINADWVHQITAISDKVRALKEDLKKLEGGINLGDQVGVHREISRLREALEATRNEGEQVKSKHGSWYFEGPRKGIGPVLTANKLKDEDLEKHDRDEFGAILSEISVAANEVAKINRNDIDTAAQALLIRLDNLQSKLTKSHDEALADIRKNIESEYTRIHEMIGGLVSGLFAESAGPLGKQFEARGGPKFEAMKNDRKAIAAEIEAEKRRIESIPTKLADIRKQVERVLKGVPPEFTRDVQDLVPKLMSLINEMNHSMDEAGHVLQTTSASLQQYYTERFG